MTRIVTTHYRYKPPLKKGKAVAIAGPAIVRKGVAKPAALPVEAPDRLPEQSANDDHKPTIVTTISRKRAKLSHAMHKMAGAPDPEAASVNPSGGKNAAIVTARRPGTRRVDVPDLTPEEHQRRGEAADALWRELVRRATAKDQP